MPSDDHLRPQPSAEPSEAAADGHHRSTPAPPHPGSRSAGTRRSDPRVHHHLVQVCAACGSAWQQLGRERGRVRRILEMAIPTTGGRPPEPPPHHLPAFLEEAEQERRELSELRAFHRKVRKEAGELERLSPAERRRAVEGSRGRFRSAALAEQLIERIRERVRHAPRDAGDLAALVPRILHWTPADTDPVRVQELLHRAAAWHANALRVLGDLPAADRAFAALRCRLATHPVAAPGVLAEITSLEASLRFDQRRLEVAAEQIEQATRLYRQAGDGDGVARVLLQKAMVDRELDRPAAALATYEEARGLLERDDPDWYLLFCAVSGALPLLCNLGRYREARDLLASQGEVFAANDAPHVAAYAHGIRGRIALGLGETGEAADELRAAVDGLLAADRGYDAALAALDMAHAFLESGHPSELRWLAEGLVQTFRSRGVAREAMASLQLLAQAAAEEQLTLDVLRQLRARATDQREASASTTP